METKYSGSLLAYFGDAVFELWVRRKLLTIGITHPSEASREALLFVSAKSQSAAFERIADTLSEEETEVFKKGRNAHVSVPKSASHAEYHRATGFEALAAALYLDGETERLNEILECAYLPVTEDIKRRHEI